MEVETLTNKQQQQLVYLLDTFFKCNDINQRDFVNKNPVGKLLKLHLTEKGRWRNLPRGNGGNLRYLQL